MGDIPGEGAHRGLARINSACIQGCCAVCPSLQVSVNGQHFLHYRYRLPLSRVDTLGIFGDILVEAVGFLNINVSSLGANVRPSGCVDRPRSPLPPQTGPVTPVTTKVEGGHQGAGCERDEKGTTEGDPRAMARK